VKPAIIAAPSAAPPWLQRATALMGLYEFPGGRDNPAILAMAKACGGTIVKSYLHDSTAWCKLFVNYCLVSSGFESDDSLWALDTAHYGVKLAGPAVGALACKKRYDSSGNQVGGHVFMVVGRTSRGTIVGRGGNQSDMVCDSEYDPSTISSYNWPKGYPLPVGRTTLENLPVVTPAPKVHREFATLPPASPIQQPAGKGDVGAPTAGETTKDLSLPGSTAGTATAGAAWTLWDWITTHPVQTGVIVVALGITAFLVGRWAIQHFRKSKQEAATPGLVPVAA
jgi:uncharacterized protein (TIGR02594 family)